MKQVIVERFGGPEVLRVVEVPTLRPGLPGAGEVVVRLTSIGMNHADLMARAGAYKLSSGEPPFTPGLEGGGIVEAIGPEVTMRCVGQRVILAPTLPRRNSGSLAGTYRTHFLCRAEETLPAPDALPDEQLGALWLAYLTAWGCLVWKQNIRHEQTVALPAASSAVALAAAQIARELGAVTIGLTSSADKIERLQQLPGTPYDHLILTRDRDWRSDLRRITGDRGVDVFFDPIAAGEFLNTEIRSLAQGGTIWVYGLLGEPGVVDVTPLIRKHAAIRGWLLYELLRDAEATERGCRHILDGVSQGRYVLHVDRTVPVDEVAAAHEYMARGQHIGKIVLVP